MSKCYGNSLVGTSGINGDSFYISPDNTVFMLSDGASGAGSEGKVIMSRTCAETIKNNPFSSLGLSAKDYIDKMVWQINNRLTEISQNRKSLIFGTLVICVVCGNTAYVAAAGDSPAYFLHNKTAVRVAKPKKTYQSLIDLGFFSAEQLEEAVHKLPEHMWSMFDTFIPTVVPFYSAEEIQLSKGDIIVLCCDGVSDNISPEFIGENIDTDSLSESIDTLINSVIERSVNEKGYSDDLTMVVYCH
ncbi:MAG: SpoIIE family protein phosphatase [Oscillospiraceae bacterium]|nr:SpoIIE family protein phosphatase [Oscillospiraceae bacterium]